MTHLAASVGSVVEGVYYEVTSGQEDGSRPGPTPYELPATTKKASACEVGEGKDDLVLLEEEQFIRTASGLTIASRTVVNQPRLDQLVCVWGGGACVHVCMQNDLVTYCVHGTVL